MLVTVEMLKNICKDFFFIYIGRYFIVSNLLKHRTRIRVIIYKYYMHINASKNLQNKQN